MEFKREFASVKESTVMLDYVKISMFVSAHVCDSRLSSVMALVYNCHGYDEKLWCFIQAEHTMHSANRKINKVQIV